MSNVTLHERLHSLDRLNVRNLRRLHNTSPARLEREAGSLHSIYTGLVNLFWRVEQTTFSSSDMTIQHALVEDPDDSDLKPVDIELSEAGEITSVSFA